MTKKQKTWTSIMIVVGAMAVLGSFSNLGEYWFSLIIGIGMVAGGILILTFAKRKAKKKAEGTVIRTPEDAEKMENREKKEIVFKATYGEKFQTKIASLYTKEQNGSDQPFYDLKPYLSYDGVSTRYSVVADDDKIGEPPARCFEELHQVIGVRPYTVDVDYIPTQTEKGTWYDVEVRCTYWV